MKPVKQSCFTSSSAAFAAGGDAVSIPVSVPHLWYVNHIYKEDIERIKKENGVQITPYVKIEADRNNTGIEKALDEFLSLVHKCKGQSADLVIPLSQLNPEKLKDVLRIAPTPESKLLFNLSSEELIIYGPRPSQNAFIKSLLSNVTRQNINTTNPSEASTQTSLNTSQKIDARINDPLVAGGLRMEESHWRLIRPVYIKHIYKIEDKFGVRFRESGITGGKVTVRAHQQRAGGHESMESHAVRALLRLCQEVVLSPIQNEKLGGAQMSTESEGAAGGLASNSQSGYSAADTGTPAGDECPICMDKMSNKKQLKCKHEFCEECLDQSIGRLGHICPVCRDVFGVVEGDQPDGEMSSHLEPTPLPGFPDCGTIVITYKIPAGKQSRKHPNPGKRYPGLYREAYLPDSQKGREVYFLLKKAFQQKLIFTIGTSRTTGMENQVTWSDIHHKTSRGGGPTKFGYPDPGYLDRVKEELKAKGIK